MKYHPASGSEEKEERTQNNICGSTPQMPSELSVQLIRQFARAYCVVPEISLPCGGFVAN